MVTLARRGSGRRQATEASSASRSLAAADPKTPRRASIVARVPDMSKRRAAACSRRPRRRSGTRTAGPSRSTCRRTSRNSLPEQRRLHVVFGRRVIRLAGLVSSTKEAECRWRQAPGRGCPEAVSSRFSNLRLKSRASSRRTASSGRPRPRSCSIDPGASAEQTCRINDVATGALAVSKRLGLLLVPLPTLPSRPSQEADRLGHARSRHGAATTGPRQCRPRARLWRGAIAPSRAPTLSAESRPFRNGANRTVHSFAR